MKSVFLDPKTQQYAIFFIGWGNPYTNPPNNQPRILGGFCVPWPWPHWKEVDHRDLWELLPEAPSGYFHYWDYGDVRSRKYWTPERMAANRLRLMKNRIWKKSPLFADQFIKKQIASNPDYYDVTAIATEIEERKSAREQRNQKYLESWITRSQPQKQKEVTHAPL